MIGQVIENPAFYIPQLNVIWGYSDLGGYRTAVKDALEHHKKVKEKIGEAQKGLKKAERQLDVDVKPIFDPKPIK